ncbi:MAG: c-type cytochrome [Bacteroidetes bacterium]|nr:c-type cytochrome [Bacteroidota bacterium]
MRNKLFLLTALVLGIVACRHTATEPGPRAYQLDIPSGLPEMPVPADNPLTEEGVALGRKLFYDPILSGNQTMSCASCHKQEFAFTDGGKAFSFGIDGKLGTRNAMPLFNLGYQRGFFWDGGAADIESQVVGPIQNPVEMHADLAIVLGRLNAHSEYPTLFEKAFGTRTISSVLLMKAIAQFERTIVSGNSKWDKYLRGEATLTDAESRGRIVYEDEDKGDCTHCHSIGSTFSDFEYRNNGLDSVSADAGRALITFLATDSGKFKTPSLRNIALTAPYMHDGRFQTLEECVEHYNSGLQHARNLDPSLRNKVKNRLSTQQKSDLVAFLHTLTDYELISNPKFAKP